MLNIGYCVALLYVGHDYEKAVAEMNKLCPACFVMPDRETAENLPKTPSKIKSLALIQSGHKALGYSFSFLRPL
ncbi:MAG: hypothetical protein DWQ10_07315 [Calditrichaeota bacterium]|nr:MAG: hypothetical protein DWQ10_07315 [Calditrichota bacterium]